MKSDKSSHHNLVCAKEQCCLPATAKMTTRLAESNDSLISGFRADRLLNIKIIYFSSFAGEIIRKTFVPCSAECFCTHLYFSFSIWCIEHVATEHI